MAVKSIDKPAILGGHPVFTDALPFNQPTLPPFSELAGDLETTFQSGMLTNGPCVSQLEERATEFCGRPVVAVSSCTSGLMLTFKLLKLHGKVIVPSFTFFATSHALLWNGLTPLFVDIRPDTWTIDPAAVEAAITDEVSAIVAVDVFGNPCDKDRLARIADRHGVRLITDAAHSLGAEYQGRPVGGFGDAEIFSLSPTKLAVAGEGGLVAVDDPELAEGLRVGRDYGNAGDYDCRIVGLNARMSEMHATVALAGLKALPANSANRRRIAQLYREGLSAVPGLIWQEVDDGNLSTFKDVAAVVDSEAFGASRDMVRRALEAEGIPTRTYFDPPAHRQKAYKGVHETAGALTHTDHLSANILCLPIFSHMLDEQVEAVCNAISRIHEHAALIGDKSASVGAVEDV